MNKLQMMILATALLSGQARSETVEEWITERLAEIKLADSIEGICPGLYPDEVAIGATEDEIISSVGAEGDEELMIRLSDIESSPAVRRMANEKANSFGGRDGFCNEAVAGRIPYVTGMTPGEQEAEEDLLDAQPL